MDPAPDALGLGALVAPAPRPPEGCLGATAQKGAPLFGPFQRNRLREQGRDTVFKIGTTILPPRVCAPAESARACVRERPGPGHWFYVGVDAQLDHPRGGYVSVAVLTCAGRLFLVSH